MSELDFVAVKSEDPAAEFLALEQNALGDLDDEFTFNKDIQLSTDVKDSLFSSENEIKFNGELSGDLAEQSNGDVMNGMSNGISDLSINSAGKAGEQSLPLAFSQPIIPPEEPESIKKWREEHIKALEEKDAEEAKKIEELKQQGKNELDDWYSRYAENLKSAKQQNREASKNAEKDFIAERDNEAPGQEWEKINRLCDFNPKTSHNIRDTSRMRSILLKLKQTPQATSSSSSTVAS